MGKRLWVERNKDGSWDAFSEDGAHIKFGKGRGQFTPGDLMKIALAGCAALSSQFAVEHTLGGHGHHQSVRPADAIRPERVFSAAHYENGVFQGTCL